jgi:hypothetical protein
MNGNPSFDDDYAFSVTEKHYGASTDVVPILTVSGVICNVVSLNIRNTVREKLEALFS